MYMDPSHEPIPFIGNPDLIKMIIQKINVETMIYFIMN